MSETLSKVERGTALWLGLPARVAILGGLFFLEKVFLNEFVDFDRAQAAEGIGAMLRVAQHWGFRFLVAFAAAIALFAYVRGGAKLQASDAAVRSSRLRFGWMMVHAALIAGLVPLSYWLYRDASGPLTFGQVIFLWMIVGVGAIASAALAMAPGSVWTAAARALGILWIYAAIAAFVGACAMQWSQALWAPTAALTFDLVRRVLLPFIPSLNANAATRILSTDRFAVEVSEICSGLEGIGLIVAFTAAWLIYFRREYRFPRALLLLPVGVLLIFGLNVLRIAALMLIGHAGHPEVAVYGFHSQAGWIAFNLVACALVYFSRQSAWLSRTADAPAPGAFYNPVAPYLMPLLGILAAGVISHAVSGRFESFYPLRLAAGAGLLLFYRRDLGRLVWRWSWRGPVVGVLVFLVWILAAHFLLTPSSTPEQLAAWSSPIQGAWIVVRILASVLVVPVAEELAYRGYLMRRLCGADFDSIALERVRWPALVASALVFGLAHGALWLPGIIAGLAYGYLAIRRGSLGEAVMAHLTSNALVAFSVVGLGQWQLW